jgi:hypothetical protein
MGHRNRDPLRPSTKYTAYAVNARARKTATTPTSATVVITPSLLSGQACLAVDQAWDLFFFISPGMHVLVSRDYLTNFAVALVVLQQRPSFQKIPLQRPQFDIRVSSSTTRNSDTFVSPTSQSDL